MKIKFRSLYDKEYKKGTFFFQRRNNVYGMTDGIRVTRSSNNIMAKCYSHLCPIGEMGGIDPSTIEIISADAFRKAVVSIMKRNIVEYALEKRIEELDKVIQDAVRTEEGKMPAPSAPDQIETQGRYAAIGDNIVKDTKTGLEWLAGPDGNIDWNNAKSWVASLKTGDGWRMPTLDELEGIYDKGLGVLNMTPLLKTTNEFVWSGETKGSDAAWLYSFGLGERGWLLRDTYIGGGFAVRSRING